MLISGVAVDVGGNVGLGVSVGVAVGGARVAVAGRKGVGVKEGDALVGVAAGVSKLQARAASQRNARYHKKRLIFIDCFLVI